MATSTAVVLCFFLFLLPLSVNAATFEIVNSCSFTIWAAWTAMSPRAAGGNRLNPGQSWTINVTAGSTAGQIWARTNCSFDGSGRGRCETGDCGGSLQCQGDGGSPPRTLAEFALNQFGNSDFFDISLLDGYNVGLDFSPTSTGRCHGYRCAADSILEECPEALRTPGGCNHPCTVFGTPEYCCTGGQGTCVPTQYSTFFRARCPDAYVGIPSDQPDTNDCPGGTSYRVTFCP